MYVQECFCVSLGQVKQKSLDIQDALYLYGEY